MSRNTQRPTMSCCCANRPGSRYMSRSNTPDTDEYDRFQQNFPRSDYSGRSSQKYENSSVLDDQAWNALSSLRQKACRFIKSETEETQTDPVASHCSCTPDRGYGGANVLRRANDLIDYTPQSEFLRRMKQQCQLLCDNQANIFSALDEGLVNDPYDFQMSDGSPRMGEYSYNSQGSAGVRFNQQGMDGCDDEMLYENSSYDPHCSADEKLLDHLIDRKLPSDQSLGRPKSANKKSQHISRSKKPSRCRGRRKRKSGSPEKCESENQFEPTLKKPHENSCERCWRYASPARSPVNKPDQKYDPNFRRGHSCYDFERGDGEFYDRRISPCKNLQPITSREKQQSPATPPAKVLEARPLSSAWQRSPDAQPRSLSLGRQRSPDAQPQAVSSSWQKSPEVQPQTFTSTWHRSPETQPQTFTSTWHKSPESQPQTFTSTWHKSPESQPQMFNSTWHRSPEPQPQTFTSTCYRSPEAQPQTFTSTWHRSPEARPQTFNSTWHRSPEAQPQTFTSTWHRSPEAQPLQFSSTRHRSPEVQPQTFNSTWHKSPESQQGQVSQQRPQVQCRGQSPPTPRENDYCYQSMRSPERGVPMPPSLTPSIPSPMSQGALYSQPVQRSGQRNCIPGDFYSGDIKRCSDGIDYLDITEYKSVCPGPREEFHGNSSLPARSFTNTNQSSVGEKVYSPRHLSPPRPGPASLGTIPEAADSDSKQYPKKSPKTVRVKSPKSPARQGTPKTNSVAQSNSRSSPNKRPKSPNKSSSGSSPNKSTSGSSPNKSTSRSVPNKSTSRSSPNKSTRGGSPNKSSKSPNRSGNGSTRKCKPKSPSPKPGSSMQEAKKSPQKSPQKSPKANAKKIKSLDDVNNTKSCIPDQRPQSSGPRREVSFRDQIQAPVRAESPDQYLGADHQIRDCPCGPLSSFSREMCSGKHTVCCHCNWDNHPTSEYSPKPSRSTSPKVSPRLSPSPENKSPTCTGFDDRVFECPHRKVTNLSGVPVSTVNSSFERDCRLLSELQNTPSFQSSFQGASPIPGPPRKYFMFYMTKCKENTGDDDVEVLVEELTQACPSKTDSRTKDVTDKMKKIMECPSDSMALRFQKGVSDQCKIPQSSRVLYF